MSILKFILGFTVLFLSGNAILNRLKASFSILEKISLAGILGLGLGTFEIILIESISLPVNYIYFIITSMAVLVLLNIQKPFNFHHALNFSASKEERFRSYEIYYVLSIFVLFIISAWRCYYFPITPYDSRVGIDLVAKYAVAEETIKSSVFTILPKYHFLGNQPIYAPFAMLMQIIFRLFGFPFGKLWLTLIFLFFLMFAYSRFRKVIHPTLAGFLIILFLVIPELYAYTFLIQTDYSNALFMGLGVFFFYEFYKHRFNSYFWLSVMFITLACWTRTETIFFIPFGSLIILWMYQTLKDIIVWKKAVLFSLFPLLTIILWNIIYLKLYLHADTETVNKITFDFSNYFERVTSNIANMFDRVLFVHNYWSYGFIGPLILSGINIIGYKSLKGSMFLLWALIIFFMFLVFLLHIKDVTIANTFRRGAFKFFPLLIFYLAYSRMFQKLSEKITNWEHQ